MVLRTSQAAIAARRRAWLPPRRRHGAGSGVDLEERRAECERLAVIARDVGRTGGEDGRQRGAVLIASPGDTNSPAWSGLMMRPVMSGLLVGVMPGCASAVLPANSCRGTSPARKAGWRRRQGRVRGGIRRAGASARYLAEAAQPRRRTAPDRRRRSRSLSQPQPTHPRRRLFVQCSQLTVTRGLRLSPFTHQSPDCPHGMVAARCGAMRGVGRRVVYILRSPPSGQDVEPLQP